MNAKNRLDQELVKRGLVSTRSQAENYIKLGLVKVSGQVINKPGLMVSETVDLSVAGEQYVSRAALKLASVTKTLGVDFKNKVVLDVGSSTGGFTEYALKQGAKKVIAADVGTNQLHPSLRQNDRIELHEQTDIRDFKPSQTPDLVLIDVSFISLREVLPALAKIASPNTVVLAMAKPQFEAQNSGLKHKGIIKNNRLRRDILKDLENWIQKLFIIVKKADSQVAGSKGNLERFYLLRLLNK